jgi:hypothetical protein
LADSGRHGRTAASRAGPPGPIVVGDSLGSFWYVPGVRPFALGPLALALPLVAGCRFDFDARPDAKPGAPDAAAPDAMPAPLLSCGSPPQFAIESPLPAGGGSGGNPVTLAGLTATATDTHVYALAADTAGDVHGYSFAFDGANLVAGTANAPVFKQATGPIAAVPAGGGVLVQIVYGLPDPLGTALVPLDQDLAAAGPQQMYDHWYGGDRALALGSDDKRTILGFTNNGNVVDARLVAADGTSLGTSHPVIADSEGPSEPTVTASDTGFLMTWSSTTASPDEVRAAVFDKQLATATVSTTVISPSPQADALGPRVAYAPGPDRYLFTWWSKNSMTSVDEVHFSLRDGALAEMQPIAVATRAKFSRVVAGKNDFLVAWQDTSGDAPGVGAARIKFDGTVVPISVLGHGNFALGWDLITRAGQPALVWLEDDPRINAWIDPLCN